MKLSDAVVLGLGLVKFSPDCFLTDGCGCLIGAGYAADTGKLEENYEKITLHWPWLLLRMPVPVSLGQNMYLVSGYDSKTHSAPVVDIISAMATLIGRKEFSLDDAIAWIKANEPQDICEAVFENETDSVLLAR